VVATSVSVGLSGSAFVVAPAFTSVVRLSDISNFNAAVVDLEQLILNVLLILLFSTLFDSIDDSRKPQIKAKS
jgi:hypothetical protein